MSGAYVFIEKGEWDWYLNRKDLSTCEGEVTRRRATLVYLEDAQLAEKVAAGLQHEHGISGYEYDGYRKFEAKRVTDLSPEDAALAMHVDEKERPEWLQPWTDRAKKLAEFHEHLSSAKDEPEATMNESPSEVQAVERERESNHSDDTGTTRSQGKQKLTKWQEVQRLAEKHCRKHGFPGVRTLAKICGCAPSTMDKAIGRSSYLSARRSEHKWDNKKLRKNRLTEVHLDRLPQTTEEDPLKQLIAEQKRDMGSNHVL